MSLVNGSEEEFKKSLMENGLYPANVPPVFQVRDFFDACDHLGLFSSDQIKRGSPTRLTRYNETKRGGQRRVFSTPSPLFFIDSANYFARYRSYFDQCFARSRFSRSVPVFKVDQKRFVQIDSHADFVRYRREILSPYRYIVKIDIARFFPSIYTHSISWAIHGKEVSKRDRRTGSPTVFGNKLDYLVRQVQDQQTIGIPIGPDTSRIVSELIAGAIDEDFSTQVGPDVAGARLVDDTYLGANNIEEAENLLSAYRDSLRQYELDVNENKTKIFESRYDLEPFWPVAIKRELERFSGFPFAGSNKDELTTYLDEIIRTTNQENDDGIIKYAIRKMDQQQLWREYWEAVEPFLIKASIVFPHCIDYVCRIVAWYNRQFGVNSQKWKRICETNIRNHASLGNDSEVVWSCWLLKEIQEGLSKDLCAVILKRCSSYAALIVLDLFSNGLVEGSFPKNLVYERIRDRPMLGSDWLLSYEAERSFGLRVKSKNRSDYEVIGSLIERDVQFYNPNAIPTVFEEIEEHDTVMYALEDRMGDYEDEEE